MCKNIKIMKLKEIYKKQNPSSFIGSYTYNPELNLYIYNVKVGDIDIESPLILTPDEFKSKMFLEESKKSTFTFPIK